MLADVSTMGYAVIDWCVMKCLLLLLLRLVVTIVSSMMGLSIVAIALMDLTAMIIITGGRCCKVLQVSNYFAVLRSVATSRATLLVRGPKEDRVICMSLDVFLQILGALEALAAEVTFVRFERDVYSDMGCDVIPFDSGRPAKVPPTGQVEVVGALASNMTLADVLI